MVETLAMSDTECPHCKEEFDTHEYLSSGLCPNCDRKIHIDAEHNTISCADGEHEFIHSISYPTLRFCQRCGKIA